jgi:hypothetical protein
MPDETECAHALLIGTMPRRRECRGVLLGHGADLTSYGPY